MKFQSKLVHLNYKSKREKGQEVQAKKKSAPGTGGLGSIRHRKVIPEIVERLKRKVLTAKKIKRGGRFTFEPTQSAVYCGLGWKEKVFLPDDPITCDGKAHFCVWGKYNEGETKYRWGPVGCGRLNCVVCEDYVTQKRADALYADMKYFVRAVWVKIIYTLPDYVQWCVWQDREKLGVIRWLRSAVEIVTEEFLRWKWKIPEDAEVGFAVQCHPCNDEGRFHPHFEVLVVCGFYRKGRMYQVRREEKGKRNPYWLSSTEREILRRVWAAVLVSRFGGEIGAVNPPHWVYKRTVEQKRHALRYMKRPFPGWGRFVRVNSRCGFLACNKVNEIIKQVRADLGFEPGRVYRDWVLVARYIRQYDREHGFSFYVLVWSDEEFERLQGWPFKKQLSVSEVEKLLEVLDDKDGRRGATG